jgi:hypothetical protein
MHHSSDSSEEQLLDISSDSSEEELVEFLDTILLTAQAMDMSSDDESTDDEDTFSCWGGSRAGRSNNIPRDFEEAYQRLIKQYFSGEESLYNEASFERRFGVPRVVFNRIYDSLTGNDPFVRKYNPVT